MVNKILLYLIIMKRGELSRIHAEKKRMRESKKLDWMGTLTPAERQSALAAATAHRRRGVELNYFGKKIIF